MESFAILSPIPWSQPELDSVEIHCLIRWTVWVVTDCTATHLQALQLTNICSCSEGEWKVHVSWGGMCVSFIATVHCLSSLERKGLVCLCSTKYPFHNLPGSSNTLFNASRKLFWRENAESDCLGRNSAQGHLHCLGFSSQLHKTSEFILDCVYHFFSTFVLFFCSSSCSSTASWC